MKEQFVFEIEEEAERALEKIKKDYPDFLGPKERQDNQSNSGSEPKTYHRLMPISEKEGGYVIKAQKLVKRETEGDELIGIVFWNHVKEEWVSHRNITWDSDV